MIRFVDVPMRVQVPPNVAEKAIGMSTFFTGTPVLRAQAIRIGVMRATMGVLLRNAAMKRMGMETRTTAQKGDLDRPSTWTMTPSRTPVW